MKNVTRYIVFLAVQIAAFVAPAICQAQVPKYEAFYAFGDSLADTGNDMILTKGLRLDPPIPPSQSPHRAYFQGRFSNGPVAFEYLWWLLSGQAPGSAGALTPFLASSKLARTGAVDFAFGGSGSGYLTLTPGKFFVPGLRGQVELFALALKGKRPSPRTLYAFVSGASDYIVSPPNEPADPVNVVQNITAAIERLYALGARNILLLNLPDLGLVPLVANTPHSPILSALSTQHNTLLAKALQDLAGQLLGTKLILVDLALVFQTFPSGADLTTPAMETLGLPPGVSFCLFTNPATCPDVPTFGADPKYFFWDAEHPTTVVHQLVGRYLYALLQR